MSTLSSDDLKIVPNIYFYRSSNKNVKCVLCQNSIEDCLVIMRNGTMIHENCANFNAINQLQLKCQEQTTFIQALSLETELKEKETSKLINQLEEQTAHIFALEAKLRNTTHPEQLEVKCRDLARQVEEMENTSGCFECEDKNIQINELKKDLKELKEKIEILINENLIRSGQVQELKDINENVQQRNKKKKFIDKFKRSFKIKLGIQVNEMLIKFCSDQLNIKFKVKKCENITVYKMINTVSKATNDEFELHLFYEQLSYALVCKVCYLNSSCWTNNLGKSCRNHQALIVDFNGIYYGGIFIGYTPGDDSKAIIQWFENNFSLMDINNCFELPSSSTDKSVQSAIAYNEKRSNKTHWIKFPKIESI
jgi:hypothetical protein